MLCVGSDNATGDSKNERKYIPYDEQLDRRDKSLWSMMRASTPGSGYRSPCAACLIL